jgi:glycosyltransferase involved in cell wall biosynthesis
MILFVLRRLPPQGGGTEKQACVLAKAFRRVGKETLILGGKTEDKEKNVGIRHYLSDSNVRFWGTIKFHIGLVIFLEKNRKKIKCLHTFFLNKTTFLVILWCALRNKNFIFKISGGGNIGELGQIKKYCFCRYVWKLIDKYSTKIVAISTEIYENALLNVKNKSKLILIPDGINTQIFCPEDSKNNFVVRSEIKVFLCVGRLAPEKRYDWVIKAFLNVENAMLYIVGDGPEKIKLEKLVESLGLQKRVFIEGYYNNVKKYYYMADAVVISSISEGLCNVMLEAMACGVPVISTLVSGAEDVIINNKNGIIIAEHSTHAIEKSINEFLKLSNAEQVKMKECARQTIVEKFSIDKVAEKYLKIK